jgi:hypothetical protein
MEEYSSRILQAKQAIKQADYIIIGAGSGLSTAAGLLYSGEKFEKDFREFIEKYHFDNLYSASFYEFKTQEEKWAFFAKMIKLNRYNEKPLKLYQELYEIVKNKEYFVLSTNVDGQFYNSGFGKDKVFEVQGDYSYLQCENACHNKLYDNKELVEKWLRNTKNCKIPSDLVMKCPVCGGNMDMNLRKDANFVQDENWYRQSRKYEDFLSRSKGKNVVLLEIGVGFNTPGIIRLPFEQMTANSEKTTLIRINKDYPNPMLEIRNKTISFDEDTNKIIEDLKE